MSLVAFIAYSVVRGTELEVTSEQILPGIISGSIWSIALACWIYVDSCLGIQTG